MQKGDRVPRWIMRAQGWLIGRVSFEDRYRLAVVVIVVAVVVAVALSGSRFFSVLITELDLVAFAGLFVVNWIGNGGVLVPIPGARLLGLIMIFQNATVLPSWEVFAVAGAAMALGLTSYYVAGARSADLYERGDAEGAQDAVQDSSILSPTEPPNVPRSSDPSELVAAAVAASGSTRRQRLTRRFSATWSRAQERAQPSLEKHGLAGMFWLFLVPSPVGTAAAFLGGAMRFGFIRFGVAALSSKFLLAGLIVVAGLLVAEGATSVASPG